MRKGKRIQRYSTMEKNKSGSDHISRHKYPKIPIILLNLNLRLNQRNIITHYNITITTNILIQILLIFV